MCVDKWRGAIVALVRLASGLVVSATPRVEVIGIGVGKGIGFGVGGVWAWRWGGGEGAVWLVVYCRVKVCHVVRMVVHRGQVGGVYDIGRRLERLPNTNWRGLRLLRRGGRGLLRKGGR